jgi:hypothetical protein
MSGRWAASQKALDELLERTRLFNGRPLFDFVAKTDGAPCRVLVSSTRYEFIQKRLLTGEMLGGSDLDRLESIRLVPVDRDRTVVRIRSKDGVRQFEIEGRVDAHKVAHDLAEAAGLSVENEDGRLMDS